MLQRIEFTAFRRSFLLTVGPLCLSLALASCASPGKRTAIGAGVGAGVGAGIGAIAGGSKGAMIGAAVGGVTGGAMGNSLDKRAQELDRVADTRKTADGLLVNLKNDLLFTSGSAVLKEPAVKQVAELGDVLAKYPDDRIRIEGHTDSVGATGFNEELSQRRAAAVRDILSSRGVQPKQLMVLGVGETRPVSKNTHPQGRAANRRVELHIDVPQGG